MKVSNEMVQRFLGWRLPDDFYPDGGVTFNREVNGGLRPKTWWPVGTNLLTDPQARAMLEHVVGPEFDALLVRCEAVEARLAEAERDAARYRFIKQWARRLDITGYSLTNNEHFEPRIDEAMAIASQPSSADEVQK